MIGDDQVQSFALSQALTRELRQGERVVWTGQPTPQGMRRGAWVLVIVGIIFTAFSLVWLAFTGLGVVAMGSAVVEGGLLFSIFPCCGLPFLMIGLGLITAPVWMGRQAKRTLYAITNHRAIILRGKFFGGLHAQSYTPELLARIERDERADGSGDLVFEHFTHRVGTNAHTVRKGFIGLPNVRAVEQVLYETLLRERVRNVPS